MNENNKTTKDLTTEQQQNLVDSELIDQSQTLTGGSQGKRLPYIPVIKINNKTTKDEDGTIHPAKEGFIITTRDEETKEYVTEYYAKTLSAVILKVRYSINSKYKNDITYYSDEFDFFSQVIKVYGKAREVIAEGTYKELKKTFKTGLNSQGGIKTSFDLNIILYIHVDEDVFRLKIKGDSRSKFFEYQNSLEKLYAGFKTSFNLTFNNDGEINYWYINFEKGEDLDLAKELEVQKEIQKYFDVTDEVKAGKPKEEIIESEIIEEEPKDEGLDVSQIPF